MAEKKKEKRGLLELIKDATVPGQGARSLLSGVNKKLKDASKKK